METWTAWRAALLLRPQRASMCFRVGSGRNSAPDSSMALLQALWRRQPASGSGEIRLDSFRLKKICEDCNNGWMSGAGGKREAADPRPDQGRPQGSTLLLEDERRTLARWAAKTAVIESHAVGAECPVNPDFLKRIRARPHGSSGALRGSCAPYRHTRLRPYAGWRNPGSHRRR